MAENTNQADGFSELTPECFLPILENAIDIPLTSFIRPFPSYINRVYEIRSDDNNTAYVAKFYRPNRWTYDSIADEHTFLLDCVEAELPVVAPMILEDGKTIGKLGNILFAVFPKKAGRIFDIESDESRVRAGSILGRLHMVGKKRIAENRITLDPVKNTLAYATELAEQAMPENKMASFKDMTNRIIDLVAPYFANVTPIRIHGDFHQGNILERPDTGLMLIDFDDMMNGTPVQDFWLLMPDHFPVCKHELSQLLKGYREWNDINERALLQMEGLRAMRMIYFLHWCFMQKDDYSFNMRYPEWGNEQFWSKEIHDLRLQYGKIQESLL